MRKVLQSVQRFVDGTQPRLLFEAFEQLIPRAPQRPLESKRSFNRRTRRAVLNALDIRPIQFRSFSELLLGEAG